MTNKELPFPIEYSFRSCFPTLTPGNKTWRLAYDDSLLCEIVRLLFAEKFETLDSFAEEGRYAKLPQKMWSEALLILCRGKCYYGFDTEWIGGAPFRELCAAADWIEDMSPGCVRSAEDKYGNNALFYIYSAWLESRSKSRGILDAFKGLMSVKEDVARFVRMGCDEEKKNSFGVSAQDLLSEVPKFALSLLCDSSCAVEDWCEGLKVLDCNNFISDRRLPLGSVIAIMTSDIVDEAWKIKTLSYIMERQLYGISFVPLEYDLGKCQALSGREVDSSGKDYPTEVDVLALLRQCDIAELDRLGTDGRLKRHDGKWASILLQLVLMANYDTAYSDGNRFLRKGVEWLEAMSPGVVASAIDKYGNNVLVYLLCALAETNPSYLARTAEGVEMAMADYEFLQKLGGDAARKNDFGVSAAMLLPTPEPAFE